MGGKVELRPGREVAVTDSGSKSSTKHCDSLMVILCGGITGKEQNNR